MNRALVVAVVLLAALAAGDALRGGDGTSKRPEAAEPQEPATTARAPVVAGSSTLVPSRDTGLRAAGGFLHSRIVRGADEVLSADAVAEAFPSFMPGPIEIRHMGVAPDGTLVLAVRRFPPNHKLLGALELWRGTRLVATWEVPPRSFAGGIGFVRPGGRIALFALDGSLAAVYDRRGNEVGFD
jgi:hypothetical protein